MTTTKTSSRSGSATWMTPEGLQHLHIRIDTVDWREGLISPSGALNELLISLAKQIEDAKGGHIVCENPLDT